MRGGRRAAAWAACLCAVTAASLSARAEAPPPVVTSGPITPPEVVTKVDAVFPPGVTPAGEVVVALRVTVGADGDVAGVEVAASGGPAYDQAAVDAVRQWVFKPALRGGEPVASRIRVPFRFTPPATEVAPLPPAPVAAPPPPPSAPPPAPPPLPDDAPVEVTVRGRRRPPPRATSDFVLDRDVLAAAPHQSAADLMLRAPGVYVSRPEGEAVAHEIFLRGFDAEHGQDIELTVGRRRADQPAVAPARPGLRRPGLHHPGDGPRRCA